MASENETIADIVVDFRQYVANTKIPPEVAETIVCYLDRIEAAWKREKAQVGNAAATREALKKIYLLAQAICDYKEEPTMVYRRADLIERTVNAALSAPARNCDVGTAEEQEDRYKATGEVYHTLTLTNALAWAQMPYEAQEGGAK